ncbi:MAG: winged helix-turn-helix transcriptional regulator, partial [Nanoarchaeota archaeon]|nr:winged helix-turn-helix transcriptional regulator [Nanoarchaeota archaeon]
MTLDLIYPEYLQKLFTNREKELKLLDFIKEELKEKKQIRFSFFGLRRIGKSLILKEFLKRSQKDKKIKVAYLNFEEFTNNPEDFSFNYVARICFWLSESNNLEDYLVPEKLLTKVPEEIKEEIVFLISQLNQEKINRTTLLNFIFSFPFLVAEKLNIKIILLLDEFQKILNLERFRDCENILDLFRSKIEAKNVSYVIAGSAVSIMHDLISKSKSPLFQQFKEESIEYFDKISTRKLISKIIKTEIEVKDFIYFLVNGHPFYIVSIASRMKILNKLLNLKINKELAKIAFIIEALSKKGDIYKHCEYNYDISLKVARFGQSLKSILKILTKEEGLNQSQLARKLKITQGAVRTYLNSLIRVDFLDEKEGKYFFRDKVLSYWLSYRELGIEIDEFPKEKILERFVKQLEEKYLQVSTELGKTKEYEYKVKLEKKFKIKLENYNKDNIEFDLVG